ncbi:hypothetical protein SeMB42_g00154 [Synchytrium endobioticum]|uniref:CBS domain-containing protein n=1 Tax=Synchytrium endobioticum TaxID=286115 RepID=A0A507DF08_9FUNG|nr:hypothetical protein SeLEV6574_g01085 [Synchytrium endobioticum]TPX54635.1 hypothetical protein SeMB42_g00154 [Synchytrium endobioticum]
MHAPIVELRAASSSERQICAKLEYINESGTLKERIASKLLQTMNIPAGSIIVVGSSGNFALSVARLAAGRFKVMACLPERRIFVDKVKLLKALGAEIIRTPLSVHPDAPEHPRTMAKTIARATPQAVLIDEYQSEDILSSVFDEILLEIHQANMGQIDAIVVSAREIVNVQLFEKVVSRRYPNVQVIAAISITDTPKQSDSTGFRVHERDAYSTARRLISQEGLLAGISSGLVVAAALKLSQKRILTILDEAASNYASTLLNDDFLLEQNLLDDGMLASMRTNAVEKYRGASVEDLQLPAAVSIMETQSIAEARDIMIQRDFSYMPVISSKRKMVGFVSLGSIEAHLAARDINKSQSVSTVAFRTKREKEFKLITPSTPLVELDSFFVSHPAAFVTDEEGMFPLAVCTKFDLINFLSRRGSMS